MPLPRAQLVRIENTPYYHIVSRCVRRTFLCGVDATTGKSYEHRRQWIEERVRLLSSIFAVDICAYAVMSNHYHLVVKLLPEQSADWSFDQVLQRWTCLYKGAILIRRYLKGEVLSAVERKTVKGHEAVYRKRLTDLSWFMKCLNEPIAKQANKEDQCTGHFWESRFKSQALFTEESLLSCMAYVDLNPVRAGMAETPETSDHTSIKQRIKPSFDLEGALQRQLEQGALCHFDLPLKPLLKFEGGVTQRAQPGIPFDFADYLALLDYTGKAIHPRKRGHIPNHLPGILQRLNLDLNRWLAQSTAFEKQYPKRPMHARKQVS